MQLYYFNCIFVSAKDIYFGNEIIGISATVQCDSGSAYEVEKSLTFTGLESNVSKDIVVNVQGSGFYGVKPIIKFTLADDGQDFAIINNTTTTNPVTLDGKSVTFGFTGLLQGDTITVDCENQIISALSGNRIASKFVGDFLILKQGINQITILGKLKEFKVIYTNERKIGV